MLVCKNKTTNYVKICGGRGLVYGYAKIGVVTQQGFREVRGERGEGKG